MRPCLVAMLLVFSSFVLPARAADEDELPPTTEFGVTIVADQIYDAIQETQDFWSPVRRQIVNEAYVVADLASRQEAAEFFKQVNDQLHERMFGDNEAQAMDLIDYLATRLRLFQFYRQLRTLIGDDATFVSLKRDWDKGLRAANALPGAERSAAADALVKQLEAEMQAAGMEPANVAPAVTLWTAIAKVSFRLQQTQAGQVMLAFERDARAKPAPVATLIRSVADTADWALITRPDGKLLKGSDFPRAWADLERLAGSQTAQKPAVAVEKQSVEK